MSLTSLFSWGGHEAPAASNDNSAPAGERTNSKNRENSGPDALIDSGRYCVLLHPDTAGAHDPEVIIRAWEMLEEEMALVPAGDITPLPGTIPAEPPPFVPATYIDRFAVTNRQFAEFVADGGYDQSELWPEAAWPHVAQLVDANGYPGPRYWRRGEPPKQLLNHPVTGICWYEADAYARWAGKRLPTSAEWERAGTWPTNLDDSNVSLKYPWGNSFAPERANLWSSRLWKTVPVDEFTAGCTPNGVYQLIGNVWEWIADEYKGPAVRAGLSIQLDQPMAEIRGGAYDTYLESQATCRFRSGRPLLFRGAHTGFRCVATAEQLYRPPSM